MFSSYTVFWEKTWYSTFYKQTELDKLITIYPKLWFLSKTLHFSIHYKAKWSHFFFCSYFSNICLVFFICLINNQNRSIDVSFYHINILLSTAISKDVKFGLFNWFLLCVRHCLKQHAPILLYKAMVKLSQISSQYFFITVVVPSTPIFLFEGGSIDWSDNLNRTKRMDVGG